MLHVSVTDLLSEAPPKTLLILHLPSDLSNRLLVPCDPFSQLRSDHVSNLHFYRQDRKLLLIQLDHLVLELRGRGRCKLRGAGDLKE